MKAESAGPSENAQHDVEPAAVVIKHWLEAPPVWLGVRERLGVVVGVAVATEVLVGELVKELEGVLERVAPEESVAVAVDEAVRGTQAAAEVAPVELVVKPAPQDAHAAAPAAAA